MNESNLIFTSSIIIIIVLAIKHTGHGHSSRTAINRRQGSTRQCLHWQLSQLKHTKYRGRGFPPWVVDTP